jgi:RNA polymerase sigma-70 factor (ECF subfamily)
MKEAEPLRDRIGARARMEKHREAELAAAMLHGDAGAFDHFVEHFRAKVFSYSWLMCGQREDAEEVVQDALLKAFQSIDQLRDPQNVRSWIFRVAKNACFMKRRKSVFAPERELSLDELLPVSVGQGNHRHIEIADWSNLPDRALLDGELSKELHRAIAELPEMYRAVVLLRDIEELSTHEAAEVLDLTPDVVKTHLYRGRLAIREKMERPTWTLQMLH